MQENEVMHSQKRHLYFQRHLIESLCMIEIHFAQVGKCTFGCVQTWAIRIQCKHAPHVSASHADRNIQPIEPRIMQDNRL